MLMVPRVSLSAILWIIFFHLIICVRILINLKNIYFVIPYLSDYKISAPNFSRNYFMHLSLTGICSGLSVLQNWVYNRISYRYPSVLKSLGIHYEPSNQIIAKQWVERIATGGRKWHCGNARVNFLSLENRNY